MAFDQSTRGRLQKLVNSSRSLLSDEFSIQLQQTYGLDPKTGEVTPLARLTHLDDRQRHTAEVLRQTLAHYLGADADDTDHRIAVLDRMVREQAFTVLNRLAALLMMEARGQLIESVSKGYQSRGYQLYSKISGTALGETGQAYQVYLFSVFDELAQELPVLFDRYAANGLLFPRETALRALLDELNHFEIEPLWSADETIGWIYQYFNSKEERKAMRDASQAPRNSRELAVRNQFFTPRYVVEFLVDNTLGRLWFNATGGQTDLRDRCQYLLVKPDEEPQVAVKLRDPRTLKMLDPACGSMHFGLYAFDLFLDIYREAWAWEQRNGPGSLDASIQSQAELKPLIHTYDDETAFLRDVPRLIIEHNIYGVDIDPRAAQIASLALWLRAQRAWHDAGVKAKARPLIEHGHVIAAIAPPAERELRQQLATKLDQRDAELFEKTLQMLKSLPELGVLLQVERELPQLIRQVYVGKGTDLFADQEQESWQLAEYRLRKALTEFAKSGRSTYQGRLFAQDALQGFLFVDLCASKYDVVLMNPPFGLAPPEGFEYIRNAYPNSYTELLATFVERGYQLSRGMVGAITSRAFMMATRLSEWRKNILVGNLQLLADLGENIMDDAFVEAAAYVIDVNGSENLTAFDLRNSTTNAESLKACCNLAVVENTYQLDSGIFLNFPKNRITYFAGSEISSLLESKSRFEPAVGTARQGLATWDDFRFVRIFWESPPQDIGRSKKWEFLAKGGAFSRYAPNVHLLMKWNNEGKESKAINFAKNGTDAQAKQASDYWYRRGLTYSIRSQKGFSARVLPEECLFTGQGPLIASESEISNEYILGWINSDLIRTILEMQSNDGKFMSGLIKTLPWRAPQAESTEALEMDTNRLCTLLIDFDSRTNIVSPYFSHPFIGRSIADSHQVAKRFESEILSNLSQVDHQWNQYINELYGVSAESIKKIRDQISFDSEDSTELDESEAESQDSKLDIYQTCSSLIDYLVGLSFGRWDIRLAVNTIQHHECDDPFGPIPSRPPGLTDGNSDSHQPLKPSAFGVLVDDSTHECDLNACVIRSIGTIWPDKHDSIEQEAADILKVGDLRSYFARPSGFFADHLKKHSKSRRQAPLYWPLSTASGSYTLWVYYPSLNNQTLFIAVNDFIDGTNGKLTQVSRECAELRIKGSSRSRDEEKKYETLQTFEQELTDLRDILIKIAPSYQPNHDDGVQITAAPLWQLFRHKPWQKVLKETWIKLEKGDFDWARLAMAYWPERVREKCKADKSLAIAHGLEHLYVESEEAPKKTRGKKTAGANK
jgi:hypothetical protein